MTPRAHPGSSAETAADRPLRADARRNRERILAAAEVTFAAKGPAASTEEIAQRAEVAVGTVFRHFPTKEALIEAVFVERLRWLTNKAQTLCAAADPGAAFFAFFIEALGQSTAKHAFTGAVGGASVDFAAADGAIADAVQDLRQVMTTLLGRAQRAGAVRRDMDITGLIALLIGGSRAAEHAGGDSRVRDLTLAVIVDGLRPPTRP
ncbi:TetR/AcrR family transcriptional regulator [Plantactinospora sp. S1510]|uniref:TetR/AcrR family transcriptional regulator n=1 Tax=Plantactinospora alkalitolerans TaxID=2789879 RepID=A0ABS0H083_9ACTN|nr:TetR/AcrR family transcriptional regulator [Plantactinospora alkalitolerans]MBF9131870.1 TetR/AcrR family transcriptional regulator [Plantactinospora alkalitolerans]